MTANLSRLVILYGVGGLSDVGRHAVQATLERTDVESITVLTQHPKLLEEANWECGCVKPHVFSEPDRKRFHVVTVKSWDDDDLTSHFAGASGVVSCLGNRQPFIHDWVANEGNQAVIRGMKANNITRVVVMTSMGIEEDWPPLEFHFGGKILAGMFLTVCRRAFRDLTMMEREYRKSNLNFLLVRPGGLGEDVVPTGKWYLQKEKHKDTFNVSVAKLDVARFMVEECLHPTIHAAAVVIGSEPTSSPGV